MRLSVLALDFDGTIAVNDTLETPVREAVAWARARGIVVILVTGRILDELKRIAGDLRFVDAVVAENGAVMHLPEVGVTRSLAPPVDPRFVAELARRGLRVRTGLSLIDGDATDAIRILEVIRALELPIVLAFNKGRVMSLPQGVSKATGLGVALDTLRLSPRNTLAIGDAENDHELLRLSEFGVAVGWGSAALQASSDFVLEGSGPSTVADYIRTVATARALPVPKRARRRIALGYLEDGREFSLAVKGRNVLVAGDSKSGKSWIAGLFCEQLIMHGYCVCVIDPEGEYGSLQELPGVSVLGGEDPLPTPRDLLRIFRHPDQSVVIDVSRQPQDEKIRYIRGLLATLNSIRQHTGLPHRIVVEEAHYFLHDADSDELLDFDRNGYIVVSYCSSRLPKALLDATEVMLVTCESNPAEIGALFDRCGLCAGRREEWTALSHLRLGQAVALPVTDESGGELRHFTAGARLTPHVRHREKYADVPVAEGQAFVFDGAHDGPVHKARTLRQFVHQIEALPPNRLQPYLRRGDFSRWIHDVFGDHALASQLHSLEDESRAGTPREAVPEIADAIRAHYDLTDELPNPR